MSRKHFCFRGFHKERNMLLFRQMCVLFAIMLVGLYAYKRKFLDDASCKKLSSIVVNIANPAMVLSSITGEERIPKSLFFRSFLLVVAIYVVMLLLAELVPRLLRVNIDERGVYKTMLVFSNIGFMGFPVISVVYGTDALLYASLFLIPYNVLIYTYGIKSMITTREKSSVKEKIKSIFNVGTIFCCIAITLYLFDIYVPEVPSKIIETLSSLTAPLSMMVIGASFASMNMKKLFTDVRLLLFSALKLILIPMFLLFVFHFLPLDPKMFGVILVMLTTPVGSMTAMLAQEYDGNYSLASRGVAITTILSIVTMPLVSAFTEFF